MSVTKIIWFAVLVVFGAVTAAGTEAFAQRRSGVRVEGQVQAGGGPLASSTVTLWAASAGDPKQLAQTKSGGDGRFELRTAGAPGKDVVLYVVAKGGEATVNKGGGDNPAVALLAVLGNTPPLNVVINEMTTVASVWTNAQFLNGSAIKGHALGLKIAAGNVPNFVDLQTGGWGTAIQDPLNGSQTPTMANFATLADLLSGCATRVKADACSKLFAATPPTGVAPIDTLTAAQSIAHYSWYKPERLFALLDEFYPVPQGKNLRPVPFMPYLNFAPSAWVLPLKFDGGGFRAGGKAMFDSEGNLWVGDNFTVGWQALDTFWQGNATKFAPNGRPLSPITTGFAGGGMQGGTFGAAIDANDNVWLSSYGSKSITIFDKNGKPLTPPEGITFNGQLGLMQGIIVTPGGDVWALGISKNQLLYFPKGDLTKGRIVCEGRDVEPCKAFLGPFHLALDHQGRIWVSNAAGDFVTRFAAADPSNVDTFKAGYSGSGLNVDSQGNVWVTNRLGSAQRGKAALEEFQKIMRVSYNDEYLVRTMSKQRGGADGGSVTLLRPDGSEYPGSPFTGAGLPGPWAVVVDGNDNVWISNFAMPASPIVQLCGCAPRTVRPVSRPAIRFHHLAATWAAACKCRPILRSIRQETSGRSTTGKTSTTASPALMKRPRHAAAVRAS